METATAETRVVSVSLPVEIADELSKEVDAFALVKPDRLVAAILLEHFDGERDNNTGDIEGGWG